MMIIIITNEIIYTSGFKGFTSQDKCCAPIYRVAVDMI